MSVRNLHDLFPNAESFAIAALYGVHDGFPEFQLSEYIKIVPKNEAINSFYLPLMNKALMEPSYFLIGSAEDERYRIPSRSLADPKDAESSLALAQIALTIHYSSPFYLGSTFCSSTRAGNSPIMLSRVDLPGSHRELSDDLFNMPKSPFFGDEIYGSSFEEESKGFFKNVAYSYFMKCDKRWNFAAIKYLSGITKLYAHDAVIDFSIALESLLSLDKESIGLKLRYYTALLLGNTYAERVKIQNDIKKFYDLRSSFVHGDFSKMGDNHLILIRRVGTYISKLLKVTCGKNITKEVFPELEYLGLLGAPRYAREKECVIVSESDIINAIKVELGEEKIDSYEFYLSQEDDDDKDLIVKLMINGENIESFYANLYIHAEPSLKGHGHIRYWLSKDEQDKYFYVVEKLNR
jgi:hypothetical protein